MVVIEDLTEGYVSQAKDSKGKIAAIEIKYTVSKILLDKEGIAESLLIYLM